MFNQKLYDTQALFKLLLAIVSVDAFITTEQAHEQQLPRRLTQYIDRIPQNYIDVPFWDPTSYCM